jgi:hypothetical protein
MNFRRISTGAKSGRGELCGDCLYARFKESKCGNYIKVLSYVQFCSMRSPTIVLTPGAYFASKLFHKTLDHFQRFTIKYLIY